MILASNNEGKIREIKDILGIDIISLKEAGLDIDIVEDEESFYGNAYKKAKTIYDLTHEDVIADDSGLCIDALDGFPGVYTHRFLGEYATDEDRNLDLIERLEGKKKDASVICDIVYYNGEDVIVGIGKLNGKISNKPRGNNGFGFDSIFELPTGKTLAELTPQEKNEISARSLALIDLKNKLNINNQQNNYCIK